MGQERNNQERSTEGLRGNGLSLFLLSFSLFFLLGDPFPQAQAGETPKQNELLAIGEAAVVKGNTALAKKTAITQGLMKGVEDYIFYLLGSQRAMAHFERITQEIIPAAREEIENFHILAELQVDGRYKVLLKLRVNGEVIRERLQSAGVLMTETPPVNVLFLVSENRDGDMSYWWKDMEGYRSLNRVELALHKVFQDRGFNPINRTLNPPEADPVDALTSLDLQNRDILKWGRLFSADVVIFGECSINAGKKISLTLKALNVSQGIQTCQESVVEQIMEASGGADSLMAAIEGMVNRAAATLCPCIKGSLVSDGEKIHPLTVILAGMKRPKEFWRFSDFLKEEVMGVTSVIPSRIKDNAMSATVKFQGDRAAFISRVLTHPKRPFPLRLEQTEHEAIVFNLE
ncbi:MAG: hypothetical protein R6X27_08560 [Candidatus Desulfacyla sp.]